MPLRQELFNEIDLLGGHKRRYEVAELEELFSKTGFRILKYRAPSFYIKILNKLGRPFIASVLRNGRVKNSLEDFLLPRFIFNLHYRVLSFLERKGAPKWQTDPKDLPKYKEKWIVMLCQKK